MSLASVVAALLLSGGAAWAAQAPDLPRSLRQEEIPRPERPLAPPQEPDEENPDPQGFLLQPRVGLWSHGEFSAVTPGGLRRIKAETLGDIGLDAGFEEGGWSIRATFDYSANSDVSLWVLGASVGHSSELPLDVGLPLRGEVLVGVIGGALDVKPGGFGSFDNSVGFQGRLAISIGDPDGMAFSLWGDFRYIAFRYNETVLSGDTRAIGASFAFGAAVTLRF